MTPGQQHTSPDRASRGADLAAHPVVFVVDDDTATLALLRDVAEDAGWVTRGFTRLADLRASLDRSTPALLILDDDLPDGRGGDMARDLRRDDRLADVPVVVCTAATPMRQQEIGAWAPVVSKPFDLADIESFLNDAAARRGADGSNHGVAR